MKNKKQLLIYAALIIGGIVIGWRIFGGVKENPPQQISSDKNIEKQATIWTCSMHPQIRMDKPGKCPICGMDLIPLNSGNEENTEFNITQMSESAMKIAEVQTSIVQKSSSGKEVRLTGKVKPDERKKAVITSRFSGRIEKLFVNFTGEEVQQGQKLATIYSPDLITAQKELFETIKFKQSNPEYYKAARNKLKLWSLSDSQIDNIEKNAEPQNYFDILSPLSGTVMKRQVALGEYVNEGALLFEIVDLSAVWVMFDAYESDLPWIRTSDDLTFEVQSLPGKMFNGKVTFIDPVLNPETRVAYVRTEMANPGNLLKPEMFVRGIIKTQLPSVKNALIIPKSAVLWTGKKAIVYVRVKEQTKPTFEYREITLGEDAGNFYVVKEGLQEGEEIVTNGVFKIDGAAQLAGKQSMMNPEEGKQTGGMNMPGMKMGDDHKDAKPDAKKETNAMEMKGKNMFSFKVYGNCSMCEDRIEKAAKSVNGVLSAKWNKDTKMIEVVTENKKTDSKVVSDAISAAGHDTEYKIGKDETYNKLPKCCKYVRKEK